MPPQIYQEKTKHDDRVVFVVNNMAVVLWNKGRLLRYHIFPKMQSSWIFRLIEFT